MNTNAPLDERLFTEQELRRFGGDSGPLYIAFRGVVYDVSDSSRWWNGLHEGLHFPGQDLSSELKDAPHHEEVFSRPNIRRVGRLITA